MKLNLKYGLRIQKNKDILKVRFENTTTQIYIHEQLTQSCIKLNFTVNKYSEYMILLNYENVNM